MLIQMIIGIEFHYKVWTNGYATTENKQTKPYYTTNHQQDTQHCFMSKQVILESSYFSI